MSRLAPAGCRCRPCTDAHNADSRFTYAKALS